jgi:hypothetical protein
MNRETLITSLKEINRLVVVCLEAAGESAPVKRKSAGNARPVNAVHDSSPKLDFASPVRFFMNKHAEGLNGQERFTLVLAYVTKGKLENEVKIKVIRDTWNGMKGLLGKFNTGYATWAKDKGWVDSPKQRVYVLLPGWMEIFSHNA